MNKKFTISAAAWLLASALPSSSGWECWKRLKTDIVQPVTGVHDLYFVFKGRKGCKLFNFDWWQFGK